jgi:hypothetical protein
MTQDVKQGSRAAFLMFEKSFIGIQFNHIRVVCPLELLLSCFSIDYRENNLAPETPYRAFPLQNPYLLGCERQIARNFQLFTRSHLMYSRNNFITVASSVKAEVYFGPCKKTDLPRPPRPSIVSLPHLSEPQNVTKGPTSPTADWDALPPRFNVVFAARLQSALQLDALSVFPS